MKSFRLNLGSVSASDKKNPNDLYVAELRLAEELALE